MEGNVLFSAICVWVLRILQATSSPLLHFLRLVVLLLLLLLIWMLRVIRPPYTQLCSYLHFLEVSLWRVSRYSNHRPLPLHKNTFVIL